MPLVRYEVFNTSQDSVLVVDEHRRVIFGNGSAAALLAVSTKRLTIGTALADLITFEPTPSFLMTNLESVKKATRLEDVAFCLPDGTTGSARLNVQPQPDYFAKNEEGKNRWLIFIRDLTLEVSLYSQFRAQLSEKEKSIKDLGEAHVLLEEYAMTLETKVVDRTSRLNDSNLLQEAILNSLGQGILVFNKDGICLPIFSKACASLLECEPGGQQIEDVLRYTGTARKEFETWRAAIFNELLDFEDMIGLAPSKYAHSQDREISLGYYPMRGSNNELINIVLAATDRTDEMHAVRQAEGERDLVTKVTQVARNRESFRLFLFDSRKLLGELKNASSVDLDEIARSLHTVKGTAASFSLSSVASRCHELEESLKEARATGNNLELFAAIRTEAQAIIYLINWEVAVLTDLLGPIIASDAPDVLELPVSLIRQWSEALRTANSVEVSHRIGSEILREVSEKPIGAPLRHMRTSLEEMAVRMGKKLIAFDVVGGELKVSIELIQPLITSLVHAFRNSIDHGLEGPDDRIASGKPDGGRISVLFSRENHEDRDWLKIQVEDDGRGVDPATIRRKLSENGQGSSENKSDSDVIQMIFSSEFSTSTSVGEISGQGIGLAAVADEVRKLKGSIRANSIIGYGLAIIIKVPFPMMTMT